jgi:hypothetical protein
MIAASHFGAVKHVATANLNAASAPIGKSASGRSGKHRLGQSITGCDPYPTFALSASDASLGSNSSMRRV